MAISREKILQNRVKALLYFDVFLGMVFIVYSTLLIAVFKYNLRTEHFPIALDIFMALAIIIGLIFLPYPFKYYGLNFNNIEKSLKQIWIFGAISLTVVIISRVILVKNGFNEYAFNFKIDKTIIYYPISAIIQETICKGYLQSHFKSIFSDRAYGKIAAIILSALIFAQLHLVFGFSIYIITFIYAVITGFLYEETRSVFAVSVIHFIAGVGLFYFNNIAGV